MKITVSVHGRYHAFELASGLQERGVLHRLITTYPEFAVRRVLETRLPVVSAPMLELRRRIYDRTGWGGKPDLAIAKGFGGFAARNIPDGTDLLVGWSSATLEAIAPARDAGCKVVIERGSTHIGHQTDVLKTAYAEFGQPFAATDPEIIERELKEYEQADAISVPSEVARKTFIEQGVAPDKVYANPLGVDLSIFKAAPTPRKPHRPRIVFAGGVGIRKGVPWLLRAFAKRESRAELHIFGPIEPGFEAILAKEPTEGVEFRGPVDWETLAHAYAAADIFCLPSLEEGFGLSTLQAMSCGLPVVLSDAVGATDLAIHGIDGLVVPPADEEALADALNRLIEDVDLRKSMGASATLRVKRVGSWSDYSDRAVDTYNAILKGDARRSA